MFGRFETKRQRRNRIRSQPFPNDWDAILHRQVPLYQRLSDQDRQELQGLIQIFVDEKHFEGCGGLTLNDAIRVTIAAQACILLLHRETDLYPRLISILVYPSTYVAQARQPIGGGMVLEGEVARLGEAWKDGVVVLSWDNVVAGASDIHDGHNVVLHEFAHQLDQENGPADGAPVLEHRSQYVSWARVLGNEYEQLRQAASQGRPSVLDRYGATNPAEFFAVATECYFEKPKELQCMHPELFEELRAYYHFDPTEIRELG